MWERVLTQPRVIFFIFRLLLYPITSRMHLIHHIGDLKIAFDPWTTVAAVIDADPGGAVLIFLGRDPSTY